MVYLLFFLSGCNFMMLLVPTNKAKWINLIAAILCLIMGLINAGIL